VLGTAPTTQAPNKTTTIQIKVVMPDYLCARKTWKPVISPVGIDLSRLSLNDKVTIQVPFTL
jgi:hypothetical protein